MMQLSCNVLSQLIQAQRGIASIILLMAIPFGMMSAALIQNSGTHLTNKLKVANAARSATVASGLWFRRMKKINANPTLEDAQFHFESNFEKNLELNDVTIDTEATNVTATLSPSGVLDFDWTTKIENSDFSSGEPVLLNPSNMDGHNRFQIETESGVIAMLVIDISGSLGKSELKSVKAAAKAFAGTLKIGRDYLGVIAYNSAFNAEKIVDGKLVKNYIQPIALYENEAAVFEAIDLLKKFDPKDAAGTYTQGGLWFARKEMEGLKNSSKISPFDFANYNKAIVLLSDGLHSASTNKPEDDVVKLIDIKPGGACYNDDVGYNKRNRAMAVQQGDLARKEGIEVITACTKAGCKGSNTKVARETMMRISMASEWDKETYWSTNPDAAKFCKKGYVDEPVPALGIVTQRYHLVSYKDQEDEQYILDTFKQIAEDLKLPKKGGVLIP